MFSITISEYTDGKECANISRLTKLPNNCLAGGCEDGQVRIWDFEKKAEIQAFEAFKLDERSLYVEYLKEHDLLMCYSTETAIKLFNYHTGECVRQIETYEPVRGLVMLRKEHFFLVENVDNIQIYDTKTFEVCKTYPRNVLLERFLIGNVVEVDDKRLAAIDSHHIIIFEYNIDAN